MAHRNLVKFSKRLIAGAANMVMLGDSLTDESSSNRWPESIMKYFDINWRGRFGRCKRLTVTAN